MSSLALFFTEADIVLSEKLKNSVKKYGYKVFYISFLEKVYECMKKVNSFEFVIFFISVPLLDGKSWRQWIPHIKAINENVIIYLVLNACTDVKIVMDALKIGAHDVILKPITEESVNRKVSELLSENTIVPSANSPASSQLIENIKQIAKSNVPVFISGESGTGKEVIARYLHHCSDKRNEPFIHIKCSSMVNDPAVLPMSDLEKNRIIENDQMLKKCFKGDFKGTILFDNINEMSDSMQISILRLLERWEKASYLNMHNKSQVRIVSVSSECIETRVKAGDFRSELFYRLYVLPVLVPALRDRVEDIVPLAEEFLKSIEIKENRKIKLTSEAKYALQQWQWPGNITELKSSVNRAAALAECDLIDEKKLLLPDTFSSFVVNFSKVHANYGGKSLKDRIEKGKLWAEYFVLNEVMNKEGWQRSELADALGMTPRALRYRLAKMKSMGLKLSIGGRHGY